MDIGAFFGYFKEVFAYYQYWKGLKSKKIVIITHSSKVEGDDVKNQYFEIEGVINDVMLLPPGFKLMDVKESVRISNYDLIFNVSDTKPAAIYPTKEGNVIIREVEEKFISFSAIEQLELKEHYDKAIEPHRKS